MAQFTAAPSLEQAVALQALPAEHEQTALSQHLASGPDYIATINTERPVSHHPYIYERRRSGHWLAIVYRNGDGSNEAVSYTNLRTGATFGVNRNDAGEITGLSIRQVDVGAIIHQELPPEQTTETGMLLGERCTIWRSPRTEAPGSQSLAESCITDDGIELWQQRRYVGHPSRPPYTTGRTEVASITRGRIDPTLARPPREIVEWSYWRDRAVAPAIPSDDVPPDHTIWYESGREAERGDVSRAQYRDNVRTRLTHLWYQHRATRTFSYDAPGLRMDARFMSGENEWRELNINVANARRMTWRPNPATTQRDPTPQRILGRRCYWISPTNPPHDADSSACWTDDGYVLAEAIFNRGSHRGGPAVRLDTTRPAAPLTPPPELFDWTRAVAD